MPEAIRIEPPEWVGDPETVRVLDALMAEGGEVRFVGGCVRDALLGRATRDIDIATPDPPERVMALLEKAKILAIPTGIDHGTITARPERRHFEITTLRRDVETDGRRARVAFTARWHEDAIRRDFTMNALFMDRAGRIYDEVAGLADLREGIVRFVGDPETRIREDVLRLLRFYRFQAHYGRHPADPAARSACRALAPLLPTLSGERVAGELLKLLAAPDPVPVLAMMDEDGVLSFILPSHNEISRLRYILSLEDEPDALRRLAALLPDGKAVEGLADRLRLSNAERDRLLRLAAPTFALPADEDRRGQRRALRHLGLATYRDRVILAAALDGDVGKARRLLASAESALPPPFPLLGRDVLALAIPAGPAVGDLLRAVEQWWEEGDYRPDRAACLRKLEELARSEVGE